MSGLFGTLSVALSGLRAQQGALEITANNVANANTPGYSRERPDLVEGDPLVTDSLTLGSGVILQKAEGLRDPILELRLDQETQQQGRFDATVSAMQQVQVMFNGNGDDLGTQITNFFNSLQQLSGNPSDLSQRQGVLTAAGNLATAFHTTVANLQSQRDNLDLSVGQTVDQINLYTTQIAQLNAQISGLQNLHQNADTFIDQRNNVIRQLSGLIDVAEVQSNGGLTVTTTSGTPLVAEQQSFSLETQLDASGVNRIFAQGVDITSKITGGKLAGILDARDQEIPQLLSDLDTLASGLTSSLNAAHQAGFDLSGAAGGDLFNPPPAGGSGAAAEISVAISDPAKLAASSDGSPGSNGNVTQLLTVQNQAIANGESPTNFYAGIVYRVGTSVANAAAEQDASNQILQQLEDQRSSVSGVSMDEEASNMIQYERAYEAAARVITTIADMTDTAIQLGRY
jgi:flagellar hook-associated protein 1 FlgK